MMRLAYSALPLALLAACGGTSNGGGGSTCTPGQTAQFTITAQGVAPSAVCVLPGGAVTFNNADTVSHDIESGSTCPALNLGAIPASQSRTATLPSAAVCPFHDAANPSATSFQGTVAVTTATVGGGGGGGY